MSQVQHPLLRMGTVCGAGNYTIVPICQAKGTHSDYGPSIHTPLAGVVSFGQRKTRRLGLAFAINCIVSLGGLLQIHGSGFEGWIIRSKPRGALERFNANFLNGGSERLPQSGL